MNIKDILNIDGKDITIKIEDAIDEVRKKFPDLITDRTCLIYSSYLKESLNKQHVLNRLINTKELGYPYQHQFNLVTDNKDYYLIDLTYKQFQNPEFIELQLRGYMKVNKEDWEKYLEIVGKDKKEYMLDEMFEILPKKR